MLSVTALYAALLVAVFGWLSVKVGNLRGRTGISILHGDDMQLATAMRRHANFTEYVPLALILMGIVEINGGNAVFLHIVCVGLVIFRIAHPLGLHHDRMDHPLRLVGAAGTSLMIILLSLVALWQGIRAFV